MAVLTLGLRNLERQIDMAFPNRRRPDGWIGDEAHRKRTSGHNPDDTPGSRPAWDGDPDTLAEVRALDVAADLGDGVTGQDLVDHLVRLPKLSTVVRYLIHRGRIYHVRKGFEPESFDGDPHTDHVHIEGAWTQAADNDTSFDYHLEEIPVAMTAADKVWIQQQYAQLKKDILAEVVGLNDKIGNAGHPDRTLGQQLNDTSNLRGFLVGDHLDSPNAAVAPGSPLDRIVKAADKTLAE
ncbi:hypothetical protein [Actinoplanes subtropicus]|uniref:hypothetical protein n=1 Tax=Actinoplanes subtropicus TaxID=543632 RepID=UPI00068BBBAC|nr:hypothetical protein [Actinoplanes subtropicus]